MSDGTTREESGGFNVNGVWEVQGSYSFIGNNGVTYLTKFIADDEGYRLIKDGVASIPSSNQRKVPPTNSNNNPQDISNNIDIRISDVRENSPSQIVDQAPNIVQ